METHFENLVQAHSVMARERVLRDLKTLARDAEDLLKATAGDLSEKTKVARAHLTGVLERAKKTGVELQELTIASAKTGAKRADAMIRDHPYESISIAFGIGVLVGVLVRRK
jgi:ElaB/YqjD/DUF883 family membrane-anchored ribosome-binding protein